MTPTPAAAASAVPTPAVSVAPTTIIEAIMFVTSRLSIKVLHNFIYRRREELAKVIYKCVIQFGSRRWLWQMVEFCPLIYLESFGKSFI